MTTMGGFDQALHQAESRWCCGDLAGALEHYDSALQIANQAGDRGKIGMVMAGKGCALASTKDIENVEIGLGCYHVAHSVAEKQGLNSQATFVQQLIKSTTNTLWQMKKERGDVADVPLHTRAEPGSMKPPPAPTQPSPGSELRGESSFDRRFPSPDAVHG